MITAICRPYSPSEMLARFLSKLLQCKELTSPLETPGEGEKRMFLSLRISDTDA